MKTQKLTNKSSIALSCGILFAFLLCGIPLFWFMATGRFQQFTRPFAYAAQTSVGIPLSSETPVPVGVVSETPTVDSVSQPFGERFKQADPYISEALQYSSQGAYANAVLSWDKALEIVPDWAEGHYNRGRDYLELLKNQRSQEEFMHYLSLAGADFDKAIELAPYEKGDYYYGRFEYYQALSDNQTLRADSDQLELIALDNLLMANRLGNFQKDSETKLALVYSSVGKCDEAIEQANHLMADTEEPTIDMTGSLSIGYFCKGDFQNALKYMNEVVKGVDNCRSRLDRARILYAMGKSDDAMADLDYSISKDPYYCGMRYYLRGLIYAERGDLEKAQEDLYFGMGQTWEQGGLLSYAQGKIALVQGDNAEAIQYLQEAEATYTFHDPILIKIQGDLAALGATPREVASSFPAATAIPIPSPLPTAQPTSTIDPSLPTLPSTPPPILQMAQSVNMEGTVGPITIGPSYARLWRFQPAQSLDHRDVQQLSIWVLASDTNQRLPRQLQVWNFRTNLWADVQAFKWGENRLDFPDEYVSTDGDVVIQLLHYGDNLETTIDTIGITLILQRTDGSIEVHGMTP